MIGRRELWKAKHENLVRLAGWLGLQLCACTDERCRMRLIEAVARRIG